MRESIQYEEKKNRYDFCLYAHFSDNERWYQKRFVVGLSLTHSNILHSEININSLNVEYKNVNKHHRL